MTRRKRSQPLGGTLAEMEESILALAARSSISKLIEIDNFIFTTGGIVGDIRRHPRPKALLKEAIRYKRTGAEVRKAFLAIGVREFGREPLDFGKAVPGTLFPMRDPGRAEAFYMGKVRRLLRNEHALILADADTLAGMEVVARAGEPRDGKGKVNVLVGVIPWSYALLVRKNDSLREILRFKDNDPAWLRGIAYEPHLDGKRLSVRTTELPANPLRADKQFRRLFFEVLHPRLFTPPT